MVDLRSKGGPRVGDGVDGCLSCAVATLDAMTPRPAFVLACIAVCGVAVTAQRPTFSAGTESVRIDVLVTEGGRIVRDLSPGDFEVRDEGVLQQLDVASFEHVPISVALALDTSHSVRGLPLQQLQLAGRELLDGLHDGDRAALVTFDTKVTLVSGATSNLVALRGIFGSVRAAGISAAGGTAIVDAAYTAMVVSETAGYRPLVIVFSDGVDTASWMTSRQVVDAARRLGTVVYAVGVRGSGDTSFLREVTRLTGGDVLESDSLESVRSAFSRILEEFRSRYLLSYTPQAVSSGGWHRLDVRVKGRRVVVKARAGYMVGQ